LESKKNSISYWGEKKGKKEGRAARLGVWDSIPEFGKVSLGDEGGPVIYFS